jgi:hypothetical protein
MVPNLNWPDRLINFWEEIKRDLRKRWYWVFIAIPTTVVYVLLQDRIVGAANRYIDAHVLAAVNIPSGIWGLAVGAVLSIVLLTFVLLIHAYIASFRTNSQVTKSDAPSLPLRTLPDRARALAKELTEFVDSKEFDPFKIAFGYDHRFKERVNKMLSELGEEGVFDLMEDWVVNPRAQTAENIRTNIVKRLYDLTTRLEAKRADSSIDDELKWEPAGHGGPEIVINFKPPSGTTFAGKSKEMFVENASDTDAHNVKLQDISIDANDLIIATFPLIPRLRTRTEEQLTCTLRGTVPESKENEFEMVFYAMRDAKPGFVALGEGGRMWMTLPIFITFEDYAGDKYRARFEFHSDDWFLHATTRLLGRQKLKRRTG